MNYWDYIQTDALLNLQIQRTDQPDEMVFIMYHQVNELLFKMILWEIDQVGLEVLHDREGIVVDPDGRKAALARFIGQRTG